MRRFIALVTWFVLASCTPPDDVLFIPTTVEPLEVQPGVFRLTFNRDLDVVRGFMPDGVRIVYRSRNLAGFGDDWRILTVPLAGGEIEEQAGIYRTAFISPVANLTIGGDRRVLVLWRRETGAERCIGCPAAPTAIGMSIVRLDATDGTPIGRLPTRSLFLPNHASASGCEHRVRINAAEQEIRQNGVNPYGPAMIEGSGTGVYSDGEALWRFDIDNPEAPPESIGPGLFPALSLDGTTLAAASPTAQDSVSDFCESGICPCMQETVTITVRQWDIVLYDLGAGTSQTLGVGLEPVFDPAGNRILVRRSDALYWIDRPSGAATIIPGTARAFAPPISPDGSVVAFSASLDGNPDVFYVRISP